MDNKQVIYQGNISYAGKFIIDLKSTIQSKQQEETTNRPVSEKTKIRRVESRIDQEALKITQLIQETGEYEEKIANVEQDLNGIKQEVSEKLDYKREAEGVTQIYLTKATNMEALQFNCKGNREYNNFLFPQENLFPGYLFPSEEVI